MGIKGPRYHPDPWDQTRASRMERELQLAADGVGDQYGLTRAELAEQLRLLADWIDPPACGDLRLISAGDLAGDLAGHADSRFAASSRQPRRGGQR